MADPMKQWADEIERLNAACTEKEIMLSNALEKMAVLHANLADRTRERDELRAVVERLKALVALAIPSVEEHRDRLDCEIQAAVLSCGNADPFRVARDERIEADRLDVWLKNAEAGRDG